MSGYLIFGGIDSRDYDVFVSFSDIDTVPRRVYTKVDIVGKNGAVLIDEGKYEDVPHSYDCIVLDNEKRVAFVNAIMSKKGYQRLTDSYGTDEYYIAVLEENIEQKTTRIRDKYKFKLVFTRKPQRFLTSGEEPVDTSELGGEVTTDKIPYLFRRSGGGSIGHDFGAEFDKIIGGTVAWNQLVENGNFANSDGWSTEEGTLSISNNTARVTFGGAAYNNQIARLMSGIVGNGHKYFVAFDYLCSDDFPSEKKLLLNEKTSNITYATFAKVTSKTRAQIIIQIDSANPNYLKRIIPSGNVSTASGAYFEVSNYMICDLTQAFGTEIANYVYNLEQTTSGSGVAWLKSHGFLTKDYYYAYDAGSLLSVKTSEHRTTGKNLAFKILENMNINASGVIATSVYSLGVARVFKGQTYTVSYVSDTSWVHGFFYDEPLLGSVAYNNSRVVDTKTDSLTFIAPIDGYIAVRLGEGTTSIQIEFGLTATEYEPYHINSYALDSDLELRGIPKLSNGSLYYDGDVYESSGAVTRKYGIVDLGTLAWAKDTSGEPFFIANVPNARTDLSSLFTDFLCDSYSYAVITKTTTTDGICFVSNAGLRIRDSQYMSGTGTQFKQAISGTMLVFPLATPTTEQADPYANPQIVNPLGTEEYIDTRDVPVPVGHETKYGMSQLVLSNPTEFPSKPLLEVTGVGTFWLGDTLFTITGTAGQTIYIDCETGEAWKNVGGIITPANGLVTLNRLDFPELDPGDTPVMYGTGITKVVVTPRWWII